MSEDLVGFCPVWQTPCMKEQCVSYEVHTKHRFKNIKNNRYIPLDQIQFYSGLSQDEINETIERIITIVRECRRFGKIIQIQELVDHQIPVEIYD